MDRMGSPACGDLLALPVRLHGIDLGRTVDVILDLDVRRVLGLEVRCGDDSHRFLPLAAARVHDGEIAVGSPLTLLDELPFYRARGHGLGALRGARVANAGGELGTLRDVVFDGDGAIRELVVATQTGERRVPPKADVRVPTRASAA
jgi:sporulation protein YlmC with PRC-barrel domain